MDKKDVQLLVGFVIVCSLIIGGYFITIHKGCKCSVNSHGVKTGLSQSSENFVIWKYNSGMILSEPFKLNIGGVTKVNNFTIDFQKNVGMIKDKETPLKQMRDNVWAFNPGDPLWVGPVSTWKMLLGASGVCA